jgi:alkylation response protein AidB-like acyl-CoA dehydrogenase
MEIHGAEGCMMNARVDKLVRDAMVWTHLAGDTVQRVKVLKRLKGNGSAPASAD